MLGYLEVVTRNPHLVGVDDVERLRGVGLSDQAVHEALYVAFVFNIIDRLADAFDFEVSSPKSRSRLALILYRIGYGVASIPG